VMDMGELRLILPMIFLAGSVSAGELAIPPVSYPQIIARGKTVEAFVPRGWTVESRATGDLNGDGRPDVAMLLHDADPKNVIDGRPANGPEHFDTNPYMLVVLLASAEGGYDLALQNHTFVGRPEYPVNQGRDVAINRGALIVGFVVSWGAQDFEPRFRFRLQDKHLMLIGYDYIGAAHGEYLSMGVNMLTGRVEETGGIVTGPGGNHHSKTKSARVPVEPLMALEQIDSLGYRPKQLCVLEAWLCKGNTR